MGDFGAGFPSAQSVSTTFPRPRLRPRPDRPVVVFGWSSDCGLLPCRSAGSGSSKPASECPCRAGRRGRSGRHVVIGLSPHRDYEISSKKSHRYRWQIRRQTQRVGTKIFCALGASFEESLFFASKENKGAEMKDVRNNLVKKTAVSFGFSIMTVGASLADPAALYESGWEKIDSGDTVGGVAIFQQLAESGDGRGYNGLGLVSLEEYHSGSLEKGAIAHKNFLKSADLGYPSAYVNLAVNFAVGIGTDMDADVAEQNLQKGILLGYNNQNYIVEVQRYVTDALRHEAEVSTGSGKLNSEKFKKASSFVVSAGESSDIPSENYPIWGNCWVAFDVTLPISSARIRLIYDFNKANWKSAAYSVVDGAVNLTVDGSEGIFTIDQMSAEQEIMMFPMLSSMAGSNSYFPIRLVVPKERFEKALVDLASECPGENSEY